MDQDLINMVVVNMPNFVGLLVCVFLQWRVISRLLDKIDSCDCRSKEEKRAGQ